MTCWSCFPDWTGRVIRPAGSPCEPWSPDGAGRQHQLVGDWLLPSRPGWRTVQLPGHPGEGHPGSGHSGAAKFLVHWRSTSVGPREHRRVRRRRFLTHKMKGLSWWMGSSAFFGVTGVQQHIELGEQAKGGAMSLGVVLTKSLFRLWRGLSDLRSVMKGHLGASIASISF